MEIYIIRHGTTAANQNRVFQGHRNYPLCEQGLAEAHRLAERLENITFDAIYTSDLSRARETARVIAQKRNIKVNAVDILRECRWGIIEGRTWPEIQRDYPLLANKLKDNFYQTFIPGQETWQQLKTRIHKVQKVLFSSQFFPYGRVALVSHGRFLNAFLVDFFGLHFYSPWPFALNPASLTVVEVLATGRRCLRLFNDTCHLPGQIYWTNPLYSEKRIK